MDSTQNWSSGGKYPGGMSLCRFCSTFPLKANIPFSSWSPKAELNWSSAIGMKFNESAIITIWCRVLFCLNSLGITLKNNPGWRITDSKKLIVSNQNIRLQIVGEEK